MEVRQLRYFISVAECKSFTRASKACFLSQSAISQQIKALEEELKVELFHRDLHDIRLTEAGEELLPYARRVVRDMDETKEHITGLNDMLCGSLNIGIGSFIEPYIRVATTKFMEEYPHVMLNLVYSKAKYLNAMLQDHEIDLAFTMNTAYSHEGIESMPIIPFHVSAILPSTHTLASKEKVKFEDLVRHRVIMPDVGTRPMRTIRRYSGFDIDKLNVCAVVNDPEAALNLVQQTGTITFLPRLYVNNRPMLCARPIEGLEMELMSNAHWLRDAHRKKAAKAFLDIVKSEAVPWCKYICGE